jgi:hypothetical protein
MLVALRDSLVDASWPVRDRACIAIGRYIRSIWNRNLDLQSAADIRLIPIPTTEMILHYDPQLGSGEGKEGEVAQEDQERLPVIKIIQESVEILLSYLHTDPFRPVRESAAIAIVDCVLPPAAPLTATTENPLKVSLSFTESSCFPSASFSHLLSSVPLNVRLNSKIMFGKKLKIICNLIFSLRRQLHMKQHLSLHLLHLSNPLPMSLHQLQPLRDLSTKPSVSFLTLWYLN